MANNFSNDSECRALWKFESGALTTDSKGGNTLSTSGSPSSETGDYQEGSGCVDLERGDTDYLYITDTNLDTDYPFKYGDTVKEFSFTGWIKLESTNDTCTIYQKGSGGNASIWLKVSTTDLILSVYDGAWEDYTFGTSLTTGVWYHIGATYEDTGKAYRIRVWDDNASDFLGTDLTGTGTGDINDTTDTVYVGVAAGINSHCFDGFIDEVAIFSRILTTAQIDQIRGGTYGGSGVSTTTTTTTTTSSTTSSTASSTSTFSTTSSTQFGDTTVSTTTTTTTTSSTYSTTTTTAPGDTVIGGTLVVVSTV